MLLILCHFMVGSFSFQLKYQPSGVFDTHLSRGSAAVNAQGDVYILNQREGLVHRFTPDGASGLIIGGKGQGPGQYTRPEQVFTDGNLLFIVDQGGNRILCYNNRDGAFLMQLTAPIGMQLKRARDIWIYGDWRRKRFNDNATTVYLGDHQLVNEKRLLSWSRHGDQIERVFKRKAGEPLRIPYNPVRNIPKIAVAFSGKYAYVYQPDQRLRIHVIDLDAQKVSNTIDLAIKRYDFDTRWAERMMANETQVQKNRGHSIKHKANFPKYFPIVSLLRTDEFDNLIIGRMISGFDPLTYLAFTPNGEPLKPAYPLRNTFRIIGIHDNQAWISVLEQGEAVVIHVPISELAKTFDKYP